MTTLSTKGWSQRVAELALGELLPPVVSADGNFRISSWSSYRCY